MLVRLISGIVLLALLLSVIIVNGGVLAGFLLVISLIGFFELVRACNVRAKNEKIALPEAVGYVGIVAYYGLLFFGTKECFSEYGTLLIILTVMGMLLCYVLAFPRYRAGQIMAAAFSYFYAPILLSYIYQTRNLPQGQYLVWLIFCGSWGCDTCAYAVGMLFGKHKLAPVLSPKKSIEGAVGGVVGSALIGFLYAKGVQIFLPAAGLGSEILWAYPLISAIGAVLSQAGDLAASGIKRDHDLKDYSHLIPGHGGIMDRFDSVIVTAPLIYYLSLLLLDL
ncbi:MAG: phosphatidate cytidylyltransferase [Lachnospiraceae bacterium]|nr:phosphatidate cytidylyltransferase [Lachnospiraceae bacterium]